MVGETPTFGRKAWLTPHPALMEYHSFDDKQVASRIFEKGLEQFGDEIDYVLRYLGFLISINDGNSEWTSLFLLYRAEISA